MNWPVYMLGELASKEPNSFVDGPFGSDLKTTEYVDEGVPLIRIQNVKPGFFLPKDIKYITPAKAQELKRHNYRPGDVVITKLGNPGTACIVPPDAQPGIIVADIVRFRGQKEKIDYSYLVHFLNSASSKGQIGQYAKGSTRTRINLSSIKSIEIPLPPLPEQQRIAAILDTADALRGRRRAALGKLDALLQSVFLDMFGDPVGNERGWEEQTIESLSDLVRGSSPRPKSDSRYYGGSVPRLMVADLTRDGLFVTPQIDSLTELGARQSRFTTKGTVVMAVSGNVGLTAILEVDACIHDGFVAFNNLPKKKITAKYLMFCMHLLKQTHEVRRDGAIFQNITTDGIKKMSIPLPPLDKQQKWDLLLDTYRMWRALYATSEQKLTGLFMSLQQRAFRGGL